MIVQAALREDVSVGELAKLAESDPGFAVRLLALVNSPAYGARKVSNVGQASSLLGIRGLRNLALSFVVSDMAPTGDAGKSLLAASLRRAVAARKVGEAVGFRDLDACFTTGLLLEVGLLRQAAESLDEAASIARAPAAQRPVLERASGWQGHPDGGAALARELGLPDEMVEAIHSHHADALPEAPLPQIAWVAERVAALFEGGAVADVRQAADDALSAIGVGKDPADSLLAELPEALEEAARGLKRDIGKQPNLDELVLDANKYLVQMNARYESVILKLERLVAEKEELTAQLQDANARLASLAATDGLTGLPNKRSLTEHLSRSLARADRERTDLTLIVVDIDHFKSFNDTHGHATGDDVLKHVAESIAAGIRTSDFVGRFGGEEFVVVLPATGAEGGLLLAERLRGGVAELEVPGPNGILQVTASFGVATARGPGCRDAAASLFEKADKALYRAKEQGRNCVVAAT